MEQFFLSNFCLNLSMQRIFHFILEIIGWIQIMLSPTLLGCLIGAIIYYNFQTNIGLVVAIGVIVIGFIIGIFFANKKFKTTGTISFLSQISATPDIDEKKKE